VSDLYVIHGKLDTPVVMNFRAFTPEKDIAVFIYDISQVPGDGVVEVKNNKGGGSEKWWGEKNQNLYDFRASILADHMAMAYSKSIDFVRVIADRLHYIFGATIKIQELEFIYNATQLEQCIEGKRDEFEIIPIGTAVRSKRKIENVHVASLINPSQRASKALTWLRKAMEEKSLEEQYVQLYFALECISNDVKKTEVTTHICQACSKPTGIPKSQTDGIKELIRRHPELPGDTFKKISRIRGKIVHGSDDPESKDDIVRYAPVLHRLVIDGIAISLRVDPSSINFQKLHHFEIMVNAVAKYSPDRNPTTEWGRSMLKTLEQSNNLREQYEKSIKANQGET
jgi:hypothetical protein